MLYGRGWEKTVPTFEKKKLKKYINLLGLVHFSRYEEFFVSGCHCFINLFSSYFVDNVLGKRIGHTFFYALRKW